MKQDTVAQKLLGKISYLVKIIMLSSSMVGDGYKKSGLIIKRCATHVML